VATRGRRWAPDTGRCAPGAVEAKWDAIHEHVTQISDQSPFMLMGFDGWREGWANESYILRESRGPATLPETDLFAGLS